MDHEVNAYHPRFGTLVALDGTEPFFTGAHDTRYVAGFWGPWRIFAVLPMAEVTVTA